MSKYEQTDLQAAAEDVVSTARGGDLRDLAHKVDQLDRVRTAEILATAVPAVTAVPSTSTSAVTLSGRLIDDPTIRYTKEGRANCILRVLLPGGTDDAGFELAILAWDDLGENVALSLCRGHHVTVSGHLAGQDIDNPDTDRDFEIVLVATDVSASLSHATAEVSRVERRVP